MSSALRACRFLLAPSKSGVSSAAKAKAKTKGEAKTSRQPGGLQKLVPVSPTLASFVGSSQCTRAEAVSHVFVQYYFDKKDNVKGETLDLKELEGKRQELEKTPAIYAILPIVPIVLLLIFNKMVFKTVTMNVATAMFVAWFLAFLLDLVVRRDVRKSFELSFALFKGMGNILTSTIGLIFVAAFFATGLQNIGLVTMLINGAKNIGLDVTGTGVLLSAVIGVVTVLTGSGVAAFTSLAHIIPDVAKQLGTDGITIMLMMHTASEMLRAISPVAGVIIIVAGFAKVNPLTMVKRTTIPCLVGYVTMLIVVACFF